MSAMLYREDNKVLWRGVRPAHNGVQVAKSALATNNTVILHTVTAGKTLFLTTMVYGTDPEAVGLCQMQVRNVADVVQYTIQNFIPRTTSTSFSGSITFNPPLEIPAGYDIILVSGIAMLDLNCFINGWEE